MTNSSLLSGLSRKLLAVTLGLALAGCGCSGSDPVDPVAAAEMASKAFSAGDYPSAVGHCRRSLELSPGQLDVAILMARAAVAAGDVDAARDAVAIAKEISPDDVAVIQITAEYERAIGEYDAAIKTYSRLVTEPVFADRPDLKALGWSGRGLVGLDRCLAGKDAGSTRDKAHADLLMAIILDPNGAKSAYYHLGVLYADVFNYKQAAIDQLRVYVARMRDDGDAHVVKAKARIEALEAQLKAEQAKPGANGRIRPSDCAAALEKAQAAEAKGQGKIALAHYEDAARFDPTKYEAVDGAARMNHRYGNLTRAYDYYRAALVQRASPAALIAIGGIALDLKKNMQAVEFYGRAVASSPRNKQALDGLIRALGSCSKTDAVRTYRFYRDTLYPGK